MSFGKKLKTLRVINQLDQNDMCKRLNVSQSVYSRYENDEKKVTENDEFVKRVAEEFDVSTVWLATGDDDAAVLKKGSITGVTNGTVQPENYYTLPKDYMDAFFKHQLHLMEMILNKLGGGVNEFNFTPYLI